MVRHLPRLARGLDHALSSGRLARGDLAALQPYQPSLSCAWLFQRAMSVSVGQLQDRVFQAAAGAEKDDGGEGATEGGALRRLLSAPARALAAAVGALAALLAALRALLPGGGAPEAPGAKGAAPQRRRRPLVKLPPGHINALLACNFSVMSFLGLRALKPFLQDTIRLGPLTLTMWGMMLASPVTITRVLFQVGPKVLTSWFGHYYALAAYTLGHALAAPLRAVLGRGARGGYRLQRCVDAQRARACGRGPSLGGAARFACSHPGRPCLVHLPTSLLANSRAALNTYSRPPLLTHPLLPSSIRPHQAIRRPRVWIQLRLSVPPLRLTRPRRPGGRAAGRARALGRARARGRAGARGSGCVYPGGCGGRRQRPRPPPRAGGGGAVGGDGGGGHKRCRQRPPRRGRRAPAAGRRRQARRPHARVERVGLRRRAGAGLRRSAAQPQPLCFR